MRYIYIGIPHNDLVWSVYQYMNFNHELTLGKSYEVLDETSVGDVNYYYVVQDDGKGNCWPVKLFKTPQELRDMKLNQILL
jgi:hypothetical protein